jgi:trans-2-enoyl-CoA reductase
LYRYDRMEQSLKCSELLMAAYGLVEDIAVPEGKWLLQTAAGSVLGRIVIALAKRKGIKTINVVRRSAQKQELLDLG